MVDITPVPQQVPTPQAKPVAAQVTPQTATSLQPALATTAAGTTLSGYIVNRDASGNPILRTPTGDVTFTSNQFLKIGSDVTLNLSKGSNGATLAQLLTVNGQPPEAASAQPADTPDVIIGASTADTQTTGAVTDEPETTPSVNVTGTVLSPATDGGAASLPTGSQLSLKITGINPIGTTAPATEEETPTATTSATTPSTPAQYATYARAVSATPVTTAPADTETADNAPINTPPSTGNTTETIAAAPDESVPVTYSTALANTALANIAPAVLSEESATPAQTVATPTVTMPTPTVAPIAAPAVSTPTGTVTTLTTAAPTATTAPATVSALPTATEQAQAAIPVTSSSVQQALPQQTSPVQLGQAIDATVLNTPPSGQTIVQSPIGIIQLQPGVALAAGSGISFELTGITQPDQQSLIEGPLSTTSTLTNLARRWDSLQQITSLLSAKSQDTPTPYTNTSMPWLSLTATSAEDAPDPQPLSTGLMLFISALSGGDFTGWIGKDNAKWLQDQGHDDLLKKAEGEFASLARQFAEPEPHHWQPLFFPVMTGGEMQQVRLFVKRDRKQGSQTEPGKESEDTRFVVEIELSQLGEMQLDGFIRRDLVPGGRTTQFDLIIRTNTPLTDEMQKEIYTIYNATGELTGYQGGLIFQAVREFPVNPMDEAIGPVPDVMV